MSSPVCAHRASNCLSPNKTFQASLEGFFKLVPSRSLITAKPRAEPQNERALRCTSVASSAMWRCLVLAIYGDPAGIDRHISNGVVASEKFSFAQSLVEHTIESLYFSGVTFDCVGDLLLRITT